MADNYLLFAESLTELTPDEETWLAERLAGNNQSANNSDVDDEDDSLGIEFEFYGEQPGRRCLKLYAIEAGDPDAAAHLVQEFLRRFRPRACFSLSWCTSCSKMRDGEFGGGAIFVMTDRIENWSSGQWLVERERAFQANRDVASLNS